MSSTGRDASILIAGAVVGAGAAFYLASRQKRQKVEGNGVHAAAGNGYAAELELEPLATAAAGPAAAARSAPFDMEHFDKDDVLAEQLTRNVQFFGLGGQKKIAKSFVVVVGLGGVGSHAAHLLLRSGVGRLRLVDFDQVTLSSLNRHCLATRADVGLPKATCLARHFAEIVPEASVEALCEMYAEGAEDAVLGGRPDYVIDAIDNIDTKVALLAACRARDIPVLCVAGAGAKADPTRLRFVDVAASSVDPLARAVRHRLRRDHNIVSGIPILLSAERPRCGLVYSGDDAAPMTDYQVIPNFRIRTIPVLGTTPAAFGLAAAGHVLCELAGAPLDPLPVYPRVQAKAVQTQYDRLEDRVGADAIGVDTEDVEVLVREVWRGASARAELPPADDRAFQRGLGGLALTRWDPARSAVADNLVLLTREEADAHDTAVAVPGGLDALRAAEPEFAARVERGLARARRDFVDAYY